MFFLQNHINEPKQESEEILLKYSPIIIATIALVLLGFRHNLHFHAILCWDGFCARKGMKKIGPSSLHSQMMLLQQLKSLPILQVNE